jgi:hypothetical protein
MRPGTDELRRWEEGSGDPGALAGRAADLVDAAREQALLPVEALARIKGGVLARRGSRAGRALPLPLRFALLATIVMASVATAKGTMILWRRHVEAEAARQAPAPRPTARAHARPVAPVIEEVEEVPARIAAPDEVDLPVDMAEPAPSRPLPAHRRVALAAPERHIAPAPEEPAETEGQLLARALSRLRQGHDPKGALAVLDQYERTYPRGVLASEARETRLEAALTLDDRKTSLAILDRLEPSAGRLGAQQLLMRAELRASAGRYADALADFDRLLPPQGAPRTTEVERALYDRAVCLGHLGSATRARADLVDYQRRFPGGKHAAEVARLLEDARPVHAP